MTNFKKILLNISILTAINIFSINCFAMKNNNHYKKSFNMLNKKRKEEENTQNSHNEKISLKFKKPYTFDMKNLNNIYPNYINPNNITFNTLTNNSNNELKPKDENNLEINPEKLNSSFMQPNLNSSYFNNIINAKSSAFGMKNLNNIYPNYINPNNITFNTLTNNSNNELKPEDENNLEINPEKLNLNNNSNEIINAKSSAFGIKNLNNIYPNYINPNNITFNTLTNNSNSGLTLKNLEKTIPGKLNLNNNSNEIINTTIKNLAENKEELNLNYPLNANKFLVEKCKKHIIYDILKSYLSAEITEYIEQYNINYSKNFALENKDDISNKINFTISIKHNQNLLNLNNLKLNPIELSIKFFPDMKKTPSSEDKYFVDLLTHITSNLKIFLRNAIYKTKQKIHKLTEYEINEIILKKNHNNLNRPTSNISKIYLEEIHNELKNFDEKNPYYESLTNLNIINYVKLLMFLKDENNNFLKIFETSLNGYELTNKQEITKAITTKIILPNKKRTIKLNDYDFISNIEQKNIIKNSPNIQNNLNPEEIYENNIFFNNNNNNNEMEIDENDKNLFFNKFLTPEQFLKEEYKKRVVFALLKLYIKEECDNFITDYVNKSNLENKESILNDINCSVVVNYNPTNLKADNYQIRPNKFSIKLPPKIRMIFKDKKFVDLLIDMISNYRVFFSKATIKTIKQLTKLNRSTFEELFKERGVLQCCNKLVSSISNNQNFDNSKILNELYYINKNDPFFKYLKNLSRLFFEAEIMAPDKNAKTQATSMYLYVYKKIPETTIHGLSLFSDDSINVDTIDGIEIPEEKRKIIFKNHNFLEELNKIKFNSKHKY